MISQSALKIRWLICIAAIGALLHGCASQPSVAAPSKPTAAEQAVAVALQQVGVPYRYGGNSPRGFDCSGLVHYAYSQAGKQLPRTTQSLWQAASPVSTSELQAGDILFFNIAGKMAHVGLYVGRGRFVHAPSTGREVAVASLQSDFYRQAFIRAGRPQ